MLENNKIHKMDVMDFLDEIDDNIIDLAIIDPPYNMIKEKWDNFSSEEEYIIFTKKWIDLLIPKIKDTASIYIFNKPANIFWIGEYLKSNKLIFKNLIIWDKKDGFSAAKSKYNSSQENILFFVKSEKYIFNHNSIRVPYESSERIKHAMKKGILKNGKRWFPNKNGKLCTDVWNITSNHNSNKLKGKNIKNLHPTQKPYKLIERIILASSSNGDMVLDLFSGSGTTSLAAAKSKRNYIGCENNEKYLSIIKERLENENR